ncbi:MAG: hypothetical protein HZT41_15435 [Dechloromonas sp.]|nr:MAG: hypothetical protein HZT41_15435 [Dechloromonas sp.]
MTALLPFVAYAYAPEVADALAKPMKESLTVALGPTALPLAMLAFNYKESLELLSPTGAGKALLEWPDYAMIKDRVVIALGWCVLGMIACGVCGWMVLSDVAPRMAVAIVAAGVLSSAAATATIGLARFRLREILGDK